MVAPCDCAGCRGGGGAAVTGATFVPEGRRDVRVPSFTHTLTDFPRAWCRKQARLDGPGVYVFVVRGRPAYVGMGADVFRRLSDRRREAWGAAIDRAYVMDTATVDGAERLEASLIHLLEPSENRAQPRPDGVPWDALELWRGIGGNVHSWCPRCGGVVGGWRGTFAATCSHGGHRSCVAVVVDAIAAENRAAGELDQVRGELARVTAERDMLASDDADDDAEPWGDVWPPPPPADSPA